MKKAESKKDKIKKYGPFTITPSYLEYKYEKGSDDMRVQWLLELTVQVVEFWVHKIVPHGKYHSVERLAKNGRAIQWNIGGGHSDPEKNISSMELGCLIHSALGSFYHLKVNERVRICLDKSSSRIRLF